MVKRLLLVAGLALIPAVAGAAPITTLHNTGGTPGDVDLNWNLAGGTAHVTTSGQFPLNGPWLPNDTTSQWISPLAAYADPSGDAPQTTFTFWTEFEIPGGFDPLQSWFKFRMAVDNQVTHVRLNGHDLGLSWWNVAVDAFSFKNFSPYYLVADGFAPGMNVLEFDVWNGGDSVGGNPAGLRVEFGESDMAPVPEPATLTLLGLGLAGIARAARRRK